MPSLELAIVGCGRMGTLRALAAQRWGGQVRAVFDTDAARAERLAALAGCRARPLRDDIDWRDFDAVLVCTPPGERASAAAAIAQAVPTLLEKPVGLSVQAASAMAADARRLGVITAVGYMNRYRESVQQAREWVRRAGVLAASAHWINGVYAVPWWTQQQASGGSLNEQATHVIDLFRYLLGDPLAVHATATAHPQHPALSGNAVLTLTLPGGVLATLLYSCRAQAKAIGVQLFSASANLQLQGWELRLCDAGADSPPAAAAQSDAESRNRIFDVETAAFLQAVASNDSSGIRCDLADALRTQRVLDAAKSSLAAARPCAVDAEALEGLESGLRDRSDRLDAPRVFEAARSTP